MKIKELNSNNYLEILPKLGEITEIDCPYEVGGYFHCSNNKLTSLNYLPSYVGSFYGDNNTLTCLDYIYDRMKEFKLRFNEISEKLILKGDKTILKNIQYSPELQRIYRNLLIKEILK